MIKTLLIGFEYTSNCLPGAIIDIYHAYKWCKSWPCQINIITDIQSIKDEDILYEAVSNNITEDDLITFYDDVDKNIIKVKVDLIQAIEHILIGSCSKLIVYFSGHGVKDSMVLPDGSLLSFIEFRDTILSMLNIDTEIFWILDCCNPSGLHLPYKLGDNIFKLSTSQINCITQPILLITSCESNEKSVATKYGSLFSRYLFYFLTIMNYNDINLYKDNFNIPIKNNRNLRRLIGNLSSSIRKSHTGYKQTVSVYSSYIIDPILWMWIGSNKNREIVTDLSLTTLFIRNII